MSDKSISEVFSAELAKSGDAPTPVSKDELKEWMEKNNGMSEKKAEAAVENATTPAKDALSVALDGRDDEPPKIPEGYNGGGSDDEKADKDGLVYITRTFTIDPAKYRSANYMPKDKYGKPIPVPKEAANPNEETAISDISLDKETVADNGEVETVEEEKETTTFDERSLCYDEGELYGEYEKGDVPVMDTRRAPTRETCETDITQCRAANPLFCRFHGPKLIEADIKKSLRLSGLAGCRVGVTRDATSNNPRAFKLTVACRPEQRERAEEAIDAFLREPGVTPTGERAYENGKLSNYYEMDLERVDRPPRANREPKAAAALRRNQTTPQGTIRGNGQEPRAAQPRRRPRRPTLADFQPAFQPPEFHPVQNEAQQQTQAPQQETPPPQQNAPAQPPPQQTQQEGGQDGNRSNRIGLRDALYTARDLGTTLPFMDSTEPQRTRTLRNIASGEGWAEDPDVVNEQGVTRRGAAQAILDEMSRRGNLPNYMLPVQRAMQRVANLPRAGEEQHPQQNAQQPQQNNETPPYTEADLNDVVQRIANRYNIPAAQVRSNADSYLQGNNLSQLRNMQQYMRDVGVGEDHPVARHVAAMIEGAQRAEADRHHNDLPMPNKPQSVRKPTDTITQDELNSIRAENEAFWQGKNLGTMKQYFLDAMSTVCSTEEVAAQDNALANETMGVSRHASPLANPIDSQYGDEHGCNCWKAVATAILRLRGFDLGARYSNQASPVFAGTMAEGGAQRLTFAVSQRAMGANYERIAIPEAKTAELHEMHQRASNARYPESARLYEQISNEIGETIKTKIEEILKGKTNEDGTCTPPYPDGTVLSVWDGGHCTLGMVYKGNLIKANPWGDPTGLYTSRMSGSIISGIQSTFNIGRIKDSVEDFRRERAINPRFQYDVRESAQAEHKNNVMTFMMVQRRLRRQNPNVTDEEVYRNIPLDKDWADINGSYIIRPDQPLIKEMFGLAQKV